MALNVEKQSVKKLISDKATCGPNDTVTVTAIADDENVDVPQLGSYITDDKGNLIEAWGITAVQATGHPTTLQLVAPAGIKSGTYTLHIVAKHDKTWAPTSVNVVIP